MYTLKHTTAARLLQQNTLYRRECGLVRSERVRDAGSSQLGGAPPSPRIADVDAFVDEVQIYLDMLSALVLNRVAGEVHRVDIVAELNGGSVWGSTKPAGLDDHICHGVVFCFYARMR